MPPYRVLFVQLIWYKHDKCIAHNLFRSRRKKVIAFECHKYKKRVGLLFNDTIKYSITVRVQSNPKVNRQQIEFIINKIFIKTYCQNRHRDFFSFVFFPIYRNLQLSNLIVPHVRNQDLNPQHHVVVSFVLLVFVPVHNGVHNFLEDHFDGLLQQLLHDLIFELHSIKIEIKLKSSEFRILTRRR